MSRKIIHTILLILLFAAALPATTGVNTGVDWSSGTIESRGDARIEIDERGRPVDRLYGSVISINRGRMIACDRAREDAARRIIDSLKGIRVDSDKTMEDFIRDNPVTMERLPHIIESRTKFMETPSGHFATACRARLYIRELIAAVPYRYPMHDFPERTDNPISTDYTGLIIDTRGLDVEPMMFPVIYNRNGLEIYGKNFVDIRYATRTGIVSYVHTDEEARNKQGIGDSPLYTVALKSLNRCPVMADADIRKLFSSRETLDRLRKCRVIFIIDK